MRLFIGVKPHTNQIKELLSLQSELKKSFNNVKWVNPEGFHITLNFLGEIDFSLDRINEALKETVNLYGNFNFSMKNIGVFPEKRRPRIVWAGVAEGRDILIALNETINIKLKGIIDCDNKILIPHITLGRAKKPDKNLNTEKIISSFAHFKSSTARVNSIELYRSILLPEKAKHIVIKKFFLNG